MAGYFICRACPGPEWSPAPGSGIRPDYRGHRYDALFSPPSEFCISSHLSHFSGNQTTTDVVPASSDSDLPAGTNQSLYISPEVKILIGQAVECPVDAAARILKEWIKNKMGL